MPLDVPHALPPTAKQISYAKIIASRINVHIPESTSMDRRALSQWIDQHKAKDSLSRMGGGQATSKQVQFAERLARIKRRAIPQECFRDMEMMSRWIDANRP